MHTRVDTRSEFLFESHACIITKRAKTLCALHHLLLGRLALCRDTLFNTVVIRA